VWREAYTYDGNGNRLTKTTPWGTIRYEYDAENRMTARGDIKLAHDQDGNLLSETGLRYEARYEYNGANRMTYSETARAGGGRVVSRYGYDGLGRRTLEREEGGETMRRLYDGLRFEEIRAGATFSDGSFTTKHATGLVRPEAKDEGTRYRWLGETGWGSRSGGEGSAATAAKYTGIQATLYARGEAVGMNVTSCSGSRGGTLYLGKDILGSVRSASGEYGTLEERYEYDAFGKPYKGDLGNGMNLGYTGKPYDPTTGLYNYGYRDYQPEAARFTTIDPVRDGSNWFAYVNNDPVNWIDLWGLTATEPKITVLVIRDIDSYKTVGGNNPELKGKDTMTFTNNATGETVTIPVSTVPNMATTDGKKIGNAVAPGQIQLTFGVEEGTTYYPNAMTISGGTLISGNKLSQSGTTINDPIPWRVHDTKNWGSEGCFTGQTINSGGSVVTGMETLKAWGVTDGAIIDGRLTNNDNSVYGRMK
jgi:RHS repeat-associated protein